MTAADLIAILSKRDPDTLIAIERRDGGVRLAKYAVGGGIFFDGTVPEALREEAEKAPKGLRPENPEIVVLRAYYPGDK